MPLAVRIRRFAHLARSAPRCPARQAFSPNRRGAVAVEFALVAPMFFLFLFAGIEFGRLNMLYHAVDNAAYEAARYTIVPGATASEGRVRAYEVLHKFGIRGGNVLFTPDPLAPSDDELTVTVNVSLDQNAWIFPRFTGGRNVQGVSKLRTERGKFIP